MSSRPPKRRRLALAAALLLLLALVTGLWWPQLRSTVSSSHAKASSHEEEDSSASGLASVLSRLALSDAPAVPAGPAISGQVLDSEGPVPGAVVFATALEPEESLESWPCPCGDTQGDSGLLTCGNCTPGVLQLLQAAQERRGEAPPLASSSTDAEGRFRLEGLPPGTYHLWAESPRGFGLRKQVASGAESVELRLGGFPRLCGLIQDEQARPLANAQLVAFRVRPLHFFHTSTSEQGRFCLGPLPVGHYRFLASHPGLLPEYSVFEDTHGFQVTLRASRRMSGWVWDGAAPVPGATVHLAGEDARSTTTDAQGRFAFEDLAAGGYEVSASHQGRHAFAEVRILPGLDTQGLELSLLPGAALVVRGEVRSTGGAPLADARIRLHSAGWRGRSFHARTDAQGHYQLGPLPPGEYQLTASAERHLPSRLPERPYEASEVVDLSLTPAVLMEGRVVDEAGRPVADVLLALDTLQEGGREVDRMSTHSAQDGSFALEAPAPGSWRVLASHEDFLSAEAVGSAPAQGLQLTLKAGASLAVEVVEAQGSPVAGASVELLAPDGHYVGKLASTDAQGHARMGGIEPGRYWLHVRTQDDTQRMAWRLVEARGSEPLSLRLVLEEGHTLTGVAVDDAGRPLADVYVSFQYEEKPTPEAEALSRNRNSLAGSGPDGRFTLRGLPAGPWPLSVYKRGHVLEARASQGLRPVEGSDLVEVAEGPVRLVLRAWPRLSGRVVREDGTAVTNFWVDREQVAHPEGRFEIALEEGRAQVTFAAPGLMRAYKDVRPGGSMDLGEVVLKAARVLRGQVVDAVTGAPVEGAQVRWRGSPGWWVAMTSEYREVRTRTDGRFTLPGLTEDRVLLTVRHPHYLETRVEVVSAQEAVEVKLEPGGSVEGTVEVGSQPLTEGVVVLRNMDESWRARVAQGRYVLRGLKPGLYILEVEPQSVPKEVGVLLPQRVQVPARGTARADFRGEVGGATLSVQVPQPGQWAVLVPGAPPLPPSFEELPPLVLSGARSESDTHGVCHFRQVPPGRYALLLLRSGQARVEVHREEVELTPHASLSLRPQPQWRVYVEE